jgi:hypothetical protein
MFGPRFLGQVPLRGMGQAAIQEGQGFGGSPWSVSTPIPPAGPPAGFTAELVAPYGQDTELACYSCPDSGVYELLRRPEAVARGCVYGPPGACPGAPVMAPEGALAPPGSGAAIYARGAPPGLMGRRRLAQAPASGPGAPSGSAPSAGSPQPASAPTPATVPSDQFEPNLFPSFGNPFIYPYGYPAATKTVCTTSKDAAGNEVKECHEEPAVYPVRYPVVTWPAGGLFWGY